MGEGIKQYKGLLNAALKDVLVVEALAKDLDQHAEVICFHAEQAAEKMVRDTLEKLGIIAPYECDLIELLALVADELDLDLTQAVIRAASRLNQYYSDFENDCIRVLYRTHAVQAILDCNSLAYLLTQEGFEAIFIDVSIAALCGVDVENLYIGE